MSNNVGYFCTTYWKLGNFTRKHRKVSWYHHNSENLSLVRQLSMSKDILFAMVYCKNVMLFPIFSNFGWSKKKTSVWFEGMTARSSMLINLTNTTMIHSYSFVAQDAPYIWLMMNLDPFFMVTPLQSNFS